MATHADHQGHQVAGHRHHHRSQQHRRTLRPGHSPGAEDNCVVGVLHAPSRPPLLRAPPRRALGRGLGAQDITITATTTTTRAVLQTQDALDQRA